MEKNLEDMKIDSFQVKTPLLDKKEKKKLIEELNQLYSIKRD